MQEVPTRFDLGLHTRVEQFEQVVLAIASQNDIIRYCLLISIGATTEERQTGRFGIRRLTQDLEGCSEIECLGVQSHYPPIYLCPLLPHDTMRTVPAEP